VIGSGRIGAAAARLFAEAGHEVWLANSRGPASLGELPAGVEAASAAGAVAPAEVVLLALPWRRREVLPGYGPWDGKVVVDATNPYGDAGVIDLGDDTSSEAIARELPGARIVKAFNTMLWTRLAEEGRPGAPLEDRLAMPVAGDDEEAKRIVSGLIEQIGFAPVDTGSLREGGRRQEPGTDVYNVPITAAEARALLDA